MLVVTQKASFASFSVHIVAEMDNTLDRTLNC